MSSFIQSCTVVKDSLNNKFVTKVVVRITLTIGLALGISSCASLPANFCISTQPHAKLVVFGDSYSDTGNLMVNLASPFFGARVSNGALAIEHLATSLLTTADPSYHPVGCRAGYNYSVVGGNIRGSKVHDLLCQVNEYLKRVNGNADPSAVYFVMMGGNDVRQMDVNLTDAERDAELNAILDVLFGQLQRLVNAGVQKLMVANSGDMGLLPSSMPIGGPVQIALSGYSVAYNTEFSNRMMAFQSAHSSVDIRAFDLFQTMADILIDPPANGFVDSTHGCYDVGPPQSYHNPCSSGTVNTFVFFDEVHATAQTNQLIGDKIKLAAAGWP